MGAYLFDGVNDKLTLASAPLTAAPITVGVWARPGAAVQGTLFGIANNAFADRYFALTTAGSWIARQSTQAAAVTTSLSVDTWGSLVGREESASARSAFKDGGSEANNATSKTPSGVNRMSVGNLPRQADDSYFLGHIAYVFLWDFAGGLSDSEVADWDNGGIPREADLIGVYDLTQDWGAGPVENIINPGTFDLTINGATYDDTATPPVTYDFGGVSETPTPGGATASGNSPGAAVAVSAGGASAAGTSAAAAVTVTAGGATAGGQSPTDGSAFSETPTPGGATAGGSSPSLSTATSSGGGDAAGLSPSAYTTVTAGGGAGGGSTPSAGSTSAAGGALAGGLSPAVRVFVLPGGSTAGGTPPSDGDILLIRGAALVSDLRLGDLRASDLQLYGAKLSSVRMADAAIDDFPRG